MSSATSTSAMRGRDRAIAQPDHAIPRPDHAIPRPDHAIPPKGGSHREEGADDGFRVTHFFVLLSLIAATVAVIMARPAAPANLILISLTIGAAGLAAVAFYR